jgi:transposase InsO family protein
VPGDRGRHLADGGARRRRLRAARGDARAPRRHRAGQLDNGTEFTSRALDAWAYRRGVRLDFIAPGKPVQNAFAESFNGWVRDECLNEHWFLSVAEARRVIEAWRVDYNTARPHSGLAGCTPLEFAMRYREQVVSLTPGFSQRVA